MAVNSSNLTCKRPRVSTFFAAIVLLPFASACQDTAIIQSANAETSTAVAVPESKPVVVAMADDEGSAASTPYTVECSVDEASGKRKCAVDKGTFIGWRTFHGFCHVCHAQDAVGSTFAPSLVDRMQDVDYELFLDRVANGYTGQVGVMPPWKDNPNVSKRYEELFAYLMARADGALPGGRPAKLPKKE
jgi:hypothetical protein